jgi:hypothetical protein
VLFYSNTTGTASGTGTACPSGAHQFKFVFSGVTNKKRTTNDVETNMLVIRWNFNYCYRNMTKDTIFSKEIYQRG